ncbi:MAG TPA: hypothetical protein VFM27_01885 [Acidimicrobiales bacterium]|nr:hypothetical protein [Acidimicrobiales bacterium]
METRAKLAAAGGLALVVVLGVGAGVVAAQGGDDDDNEPAEVPITGEALDRASAAALEHTHGGRVTETEAGDEESAYEVEVTLDDGTQVDVQLDESFEVVGDEREGAGEEDD